MIDLMENKVVGPMILQAEQKGRSEGRQEGRQEGMQAGMQGLLLDLLTEKFGALPEWATERLRSASGEELHAWAKRVLYTASLEETLQ